MKKLYSLFISLLIALSIILTGAHAVRANAVSVDDYYKAASTATGQDLARTLHDIIKEPKVTSYNGLFVAYRTTDCYPGTNTIWDMYSNEKYDVDKDSGSGYKKEGDCYNREHSVPQSWFNEASPMKSDAFHVYPTDGYVNNRRSSYVYGEVADGKATYTSKNGSKLGPSALSSYKGTVFEPIDEYKGDFARTYFYMAICYSNRLGNWTKGEAQKVFKGAYPYLTSYSIELFTKWHNEDPVSEKEIARNDAVYNVQGNRNPFIDHPEWSTIIWGGTYGGGTVSSTYSVNYSVPQGVTFDYIDTKRYESNETINIPNVTPNKFGYVFEGWYKDQNYTTKWNFNSDKITTNTTLYARMNINEAELPTIFTKETKMEVALGINYSAIADSSGQSTAVSKKTDFTFSSDYSLSKLEANKAEDINKFIVSSDSSIKSTDIFDALYQDTGRALAYIQSGNCRLYYNNGNGSKLVIKAKDGVKIKSISTANASTDCTCQVSSDGKEAYIQATKNTGSKYFTLQSFSVEYEQGGASYSYQVNKVDLKARYLIPEEIYNLITKNQTDVKYFMSFNDAKIQCQVVKEGHYYVVMAAINTDSLDTKYNIVGTVVIGNTTYTTKQITYSASDIAKKLVLEYGEDILDIENLSQVLNEMIPNA